MTREAVCFDLFDTLVLFDRSRLPEVHANGKTMRSTAGHLHEAFRPFAPGLELGDFVSSLFWSCSIAVRVVAGSHAGADPSANSGTTMASTLPSCDGRTARMFSGAPLFAA